MADTIVDKLLLQAIANNVEKIKEHNLLVEELNQKIKVLYEETAEFQAEYKKACPHTAPRTRESKYTSGGYDYKSETIDTYKCSRCGEIMDTKVTIGSYG